LPYAPEPTGRPKSNILRHALADSSSAYQYDVNLPSSCTGFTVPLFHNSARVGTGLQGISGTPGLVGQAPQKRRKPLKASGLSG
jgi:hypothetical protein